MARLDPERSVVVLIDLQGRLMELVERSSTLVAGTERLLRIADLFDVPVVVTEQYPKGLGPTHPGIQEVLEELSVPVRRVEKDTFGCCDEPRFLEALGESRPDLDLRELQIVIGGIEAHVCVMQTGLELLALGADVQLCWECVTGRGEEYRQWALERLQQAGAVVTNHESAGFEWCRDKNHPSFKGLSSLLREGQVQ